MFLLIEDKIERKYEGDHVLIAVSNEHYVYNIYDELSSRTMGTARNLSMGKKTFNGLLHLLRKIFHKRFTSCDTSYQGAIDAKEKAKNIRDKFQNQKIFNMPDEWNSLNVDDCKIYLFADEVDYEMVNWDGIKSSPEFSNSVLWFGMNSEKLNKNKNLLKKEMQLFDEVNLKQVLRNTKLTNDFVNQIRKSMIENEITPENSTYSMKIPIPDIGHCIDGFRPQIVFIEKFQAPDLTLTGSHTCKSDQHIFSNSTFENLQKLPNTVKYLLCQLFKLEKNISLKQIISKVNNDVCIVSIELITNYLEKCFDILDSEKTYKEKVAFETPHSIIGREFNYVIYVFPSWLYFKDSLSGDIEFSSLLNVCTRPKTQLIMIDSGRDVASSIHYLEDSKHQVKKKFKKQCPRFNPDQIFIADRLRPKLLTLLIKENYLECLGLSPKEAEVYLDVSNRGLIDLAKDHSILTKAWFDVLIHNFEEYWHLTYTKSPAEYHFKFLPKLIPCDKVIEKKSKLF